jgi:hypothetical protein
LCWLIAIRSSPALTVSGGGVWCAFIPPLAMLVLLGLGFCWRGKGVSILTKPCVPNGHEFLLQLLLVNGWA